MTSGAAPRGGDHWDAARYDSLPLPHEQWGERVLGWLSLSGSEHVLDAGCGTGRDTAALLERLPNGHVTAVDASPAMLARLRGRLADSLDRVTELQADLASAWRVDGPVDAVVSVAALHWVPDHAAVFANLARVMVPGGRLAFECGGRGNIGAVVETVGRVTGDDSSGIGWNFAGAEETATLLHEAGFADVETRLRPDPVGFGSLEQLADYLRVVVLGRHLAALDEAEARAVAVAVAAELPASVVDYVRLEVTATLPAASPR